GPYAPHLHFEYGIPDQNSVKTGIVREDGLRKPKPFGAKKIGGDFASYRTDPAPYYCVDVNFDTGVNKEGKPNVPYRDPNKAPYFGKSIKEQYKILYGETPPGGLAPGQGSSAQVQSANAAAIAAAAEGKAVEEWLSDRDGYGALPTAARGAYANMSSMQMLLTEAERRSISADWHSNITKASSRALWIEYLRMMAISNYLREARMRQNERIQALWSTYLALKAKNDADDKNSLQSQTKAVAQQAIANDMRRKIQ
ncbi:MAG: hypothetical protein LBU11_02280, partial [Zoogloeaceae bacterium]|nr:hypothetical protein [Zoogloeaceae bacterium]